MADATPTAASGAGAAAAAPVPPAEVTLEPPSGTGTPTAASPSTAEPRDADMTSELRTRKTWDPAMDVSVDSRCVFMPPDDPQTAGAACFPNGKRKTALFYDVAHANHHPNYAVRPDGAAELPLSSMDTPLPLDAAFADLVYKRALTSLVRRRGAQPWEATTFPALARAPCDTSTDAAYDYAMQLNQPDPAADSPAPPMWYGSEHFEACGRNVVGMARAAVTEVLSSSSDTEGALVLSRPIGSNVVPGGNPRRYAWANGVVESVEAARAAWTTTTTTAQSAPGPRVSIVHIDAHPATATIKAFMDDEQVQVVSLFHVDATGADGLPLVPPAHGRIFMGRMTGLVENNAAQAMVDRAVVPLVRAFDPDLVLFVVGDATGPFTSNPDVMFDINATTFARALFRLIRVQPRVVVLTETLMRPTRAGNIASLLLHILQGRNVRSDDTFAQTMYATEENIVRLHKQWEAHVTNATLRDAFQAGKRHVPIKPMPDPALVAAARKVQAEAAGASESKEVPADAAAKEA